MALYTIGHSNYPLERFLGLLGEQGIEVLVDIRSRPASRWCPHFSRKRLEAGLAQAGIAYQWRGQFLGGLGGTSVTAPGFLIDIGEVLQLAKTKNAALMCSERAPQDCHRASKLAAWIHRITPRSTLLHLLPPEDGPTEMIDSRALEATLEPARLWWEIDPRGQYGRPES